jgi:hypothetical protein
MVSCGTVITAGVCAWGIGAPPFTPMGEIALAIDAGSRGHPGS